MPQMPTPKSKPSYRGLKGLGLKYLLRNENGRVLAAFSNAISARLYMETLQELSAEYDIVGNLTVEKL